MKTLIIIPAYNEELNIEKTVNKIKKYNNIIEKLGDKNSEAVIFKRNLANEKIEKLKNLI